MATTSAQGVSSHRPSRQPRKRAARSRSRRRLRQERAPTRVPLAARQAQQPTARRCATCRA
eukprot:5287425-Prymnesium_polylepis.1